MLDEMDAIEILEWAVFFNEEPWGHFVDNWRFGSIIAMIANLFGRDKDAPPFTWKDFFRADSEEKSSNEGEQTWQVQKTIAHVLKATFGGRIRTTKDGSGNSARNPN